MELYLPDFGLILWNLLILAHLILCSIAIFKIVNDPSLERRLKFICMLAIIFVPLIGAVVYLIYYRKDKRQIANRT